MKRIQLSLFNKNQDLNATKSSLFVKPNDKNKVQPHKAIHRVHAFHKFTKPTSTYKDPAVAKRVRENRKMPSYIKPGYNTGFPSHAPINSHQSPQMQNKMRNGFARDKKIANAIRMSHLGIER